MALDAITGRPFTPKFKGQRTGQEINFDPAAWQEAWQTGTQGDVEATAMADIRAALEQRYAGQDYWATTDQQMTAGGRPGAATPMTREVESIFSQLMGGYNPDIDYRAAGAVPNVFMRSDAGLGGWQAVDAAGQTGTQPTLNNVDYNVAPQINPTAVMGAPAATPAAAAPAAAAPAAATPTAATASTRRTTSAGGAAGTAPTTEETAADAIANVQTTLDKQNKAIQQAVTSGLIDIGMAGTIWDTQRKQIYKDFVDQYGGAGDQYATEEERIAGQRSAERTKILADLDMRGVDASMVGEELSILDALVGSQANANVDYTNEIGDIAGMANVDRQWLGEGIFGGYKQDLRSGARDLMLGAGLGAATAEGTRLDQALAANALADRFGESPATLMGGFVGGVDLPTMSWQTGERLGSQDWQTIEKDLDREFTTSEREAIELFRTSERESSQTWQTGERTGTQDWQAGEALLGRTWQTDERISGQDWQTLERELDRTFTTDEREAVEVFRTSEREASETWQGGQAVDQRTWQGEQAVDERTWQAGEAVLGRTFTTSEREAIEAFNTAERTDTQTWAGGESALDRLAQGIDPLTGQPYGFDPLTGLTGAQTIGQQNFMLGLTGQGIDTRETITQGTPWGPMQVANPNYGRPIGFDEQTGLTAGQTQDQTNWDALFTQGEEQFTTGQENWQAAFDQSGGQFEAGQLAQGIDTRQTITQPNYLTGAMETVANPAYGRPIGFDPVSGLTAGQQGDQAYRDAMLAADETAATQAQTNFQTQFDASMMGVDTREWISEGAPMGGGVQTVRNPTYGMTPTQAADYSMDLFAMTQPSETEVDTFSNLMQVLAQGSIFNPEMSTDVLTQISQVIDSSTGMATKGMTSNNVLYALGQLANTPGEKDSAGNVTYPFRELFIQVQGLNQGTTPDFPTRRPVADTSAAGGAAGGATASGPNVGPAGGAWQGTEETLIDAVADPTAFQPAGDDSWFQPGDWLGALGGAGLEVDGVQYTRSAYPEGLTTPEQRERHIRRMLAEGSVWDPLSERWR